MDNARWDDINYVVDYGLESQRSIADLNQLVSDIVKNRTYDEELSALRELLDIAEQTEKETLVERERRLEEIREQFTRQRIGLLKEGKLLQALHHANEACIVKLKSEIRKAQEYCKERFRNDTAGAATDHRLTVLNGRLTELITSVTVAESFSAQIGLSEKNCFDMAERIWNALVTILPLLRGRISMESSRTVITQTREMILRNIREWDQITGVLPRECS